MCREEMLHPFVGGRVLDKSRKRSLVEVFERRK